jgi:hypothetical protein
LLLLVVADFASQLDHATRLRSFEIVAEVMLGKPV